MGRLLTATEARVVSQALEDGDSLPTALGYVHATTRDDVTKAVATSGLSADRSTLVAVLVAIEGAHTATRSAETLWTMPGHMAQSSGLTSSVAKLVEGAQRSVVCSTFNIQKSSGLWSALRTAATRPGVVVRVYLDGEANSSGAGPSPTDVAAWLAPGTVLRSVFFAGKPVRNHAKFVSVDHRWLIVTSANLSWSAEYGNVELGLKLDDRNLAEAVEREIREAEDEIYEVL